MMINAATNLLNKDLFPHMGKTREDFGNKAKYLGYVAYKILLVFNGLAEPENRDHCAHRRYDLAGEMMLDIYIEVLETMTRDIRARFSKWLKESKPDGDVSFFFKKNCTTAKFSYFLGTGNMTASMNKRTGRTGVTAGKRFLSFIYVYSSSPEIILCFFHLSPEEGQHSSRKRG